jgi:hypothetical protein
MTGSGSSDWIDQYLEFTDGIPAPDIFRLWSGIACLGGVLERRVWAKVGRGAIYPNLYVLLVGAPGVGKSQAIAKTQDLWRSVKGLYVAPDNMTKAALVDVVARSTRRLMIEGRMEEFHALLVPSTEFGVLVPAHDLEFLNTLNKLFDNEKYYREERRHMGNKQIDIAYPQLNILAGTQPSYLANLLPEQAWGMGFMTRIIMIYSNTPKKVKLFHETSFPAEKEAELLKRLRDFAKLWGPVSWEPDAAAAAEQWVHDGCPPMPDHSKLEAYNSRRILHTIKLAIIAAISRTGERVIQLQDFTRAQDWLIHAEKLMPDIFREMVNRSDSQVIQEMHYFMWTIWARKQEPIHISRIVYFLSMRVPSEKVNRLIEISEKSGVIKRVAGTTDQFIPVAREQHGMDL